MIRILWSRLHHGLDGLGISGEHAGQVDTRSRQGKALIRVFSLLPLRAARAMRWAVMLTAVVAIACSAEPFTLEASGPFPYRAAVDPQLERVAIFVTVTNRAPEDLLVDPTNFVARNSDRRVFPANASATVADAHEVRLAAEGMGKADVLPLPAVTLRSNEILSGFIVFDVPRGVRPVQLVFRQADTDSVVEILSIR